nr:PREDICTED: uncharacterized protein LOC109037157 [Bemisia tabaci]
MSRIQNFLDTQPVNPITCTTDALETPPFTWMHRRLIRRTSSTPSTSTNTSRTSRNRNRCQRMVTVDTCATSVTSATSTTETSSDTLHTSVTTWWRNPALAVTFAATPHPALPR